MKSCVQFPVRRRRVAKRRVDAHFVVGVEDQVGHFVRATVARQRHAARERLAAAPTRLDDVFADVILLWYDPVDDDG